jgi:hypothetical protein
MYSMATVIIYEGKAYVPANAEIEGGPYFAIEPVFETGLIVDEIVNALAQVREIGHPALPPLTNEDMKRRRDPILKATGAKSWTQLAKEGAAYTIYWQPDQVTLYLSGTDDRGRFKSSHSKVYPVETPLETLVEAILEDIQRDCPV